VLGNAQNQSGPSQRKPYQYQQAPQMPPSEQPTRYPQGQPQQGGYGQGGPQVPPPISRPNDNRYQPYPGYAQPGGPRQKRRGKGCMITSVVLVVLILALVIMGVVTSQRVLAFGSAISPQAPLSSQLSMGADRTNLLVMGYGGGGHDGAYLTDSNLVISLIPNSHHTSLISVPRDLWVTYPQGSAQHTKLNALYTIASNGNAKPIAGGDAVAAKISVVTGLNVKYWMTINFAGFRDLINSIGGIDINVQTPFNACYPANDDANVNPNWTVVDFKKGVQHMDGETAIRYARAREPLSVCGKGVSENQAQLSDFARSQRQQDIIKAALAKVKQVTTWPSFFNALTALQKTIYTNLSLNDLARFVLAMDLNNPNTPHIGLTNGNVLEDTNLSDGTYILEPQGGDWTLIPKYINQRLYN
ncbi:MAG: LCP family protein, partial [Ktedonobacteraceae bacterium]|nr:LCP family protein [Ktedonobacteraceae bacterium]